METAAEGLTILLSDEENFSPEKRVCDFAVQGLEQIGTPEALETAKKWRTQNPYGKEATYR